MTVSLIIPTYNKLPRLKLALASLEKQSYPYDQFEVILIDDGSSDGTKEYVNQLNIEYDLRYIGQTNAGRSAARNRGIDEAKNDLIIFTDDDLVLHPRYIEEHVKVQKEKSSVVHGKIINIPYLKFFEDPIKGTFYPHLGGTLNLSDEMKKKCISIDDILHRFSEKIAPNKKLTAFETVIQTLFEKHYPKGCWFGFTGGNTAVPRVFLEETGGFDENFGLQWGCEDLELGYRLYKKGFHFSYGHHAINYHLAHYRATFSEEHKDAADYFYQKHHEKMILTFQDFIKGTLKKEELIDKIVNSEIYSEKNLSI